ncbi:hypothetical protein BsWGS_16416 [Bradybaena similaris]
MTSKTDLYTWIADYACKHRLEDLIFELFKDGGNGMVCFTDLSHIDLKHALVWMTVKSDYQEGFEDAVTAVNSLLDDVVASDSLELFIRLSLGLRLKDLSHSLSLPKSIFEQKLGRHFPDSKFCLENNYLSQVFSVKEVYLLEKSIADVCKYFRILIRNETKRKHLLTNYPQSQFGNMLSESLTSLTVELFDCLSQTQPMSKLQQIAMSSVGEHTKENSSPWHVWLLNKLSGVQDLSDDMVRGLFVSLREQEIMGATSKPDLTHNGVRKQDRKLALSMTKFLNVSSLKTVSFHNRAELSSKCYCPCVDSASSEFDDDSTNFVPSSQGELDLLPLHTLNGNKTRICSAITPNLRQFLKQDGVRGCMVKLQRI